MSNVDKNRIEYFDGLKGLIALIVVLLHYMLALFPKGYVGFGSGVDSNPSSVVEKGMPWSLLSNSSLCLYIFLALISFFIVWGYRQHNSQIEVVQKKAVGRYFQFMIPVFAATVMAYIFYEIGFLQYDMVADMTGTSWSRNLVPTTHNPLKMIFYGIVGIYFNNKVEFLTVLWCMHIIFLGSMLTYAVLALFGNSRYIYLSYVVMGIFSVFFPQYFVITAGAIAGELYYRKGNANDGEGYRNISSLLGGLCIIAGTAIGLVPSTHLPFNITLYMSYAVGAFLVLVGVMNCRIVQRILSLRWLIFMGKHGFSVILVHIFVLYTFSAWLYRFAGEYINSPRNLFMLTFVLSIPVIQICAQLFMKVFENPSRKIAKKISNII